ncbi:MAG: acyl-CoA synthetase [Actinobacteria bacterium]|nr:acyl-CoA synthetase [Actinomycetota bacterium]
MGEKELRDLIPIQAEWSIPQLQENLAVALEGSGAALSTTQTQAKQVANEVALVVNTSGSTGNSKSVVLSSAALIASANASHKYLGATPGDSWSLLLPTTHIAGLNVIIRATALGSRVIDNRNTEGMTEMSGGCVYNQKPLDGVEVKISTAGLIQLNGPMIASGYLKANGQLEKLTSSGWFDTTDLGEIKNGMLKILGRVDDVIISGGEKVSLSAVEENIKQFLPKAEIITFAMADDLWGEKLCLASTSSINIEELRTKLDPITTPKEIFLFEEIPTTVLGKPDRKRALKIAKGMKN